MPTYNYRCTKCEKVFEAFHSMSCKDIQHCPFCGGEGSKLLSASSIIFKGSGFYSTDYRDSGYIEAQKQDRPKVEAPSKPASKSNKTQAKTDSAPSSADSASASAPSKAKAHSRPVGSLPAQAA